MGLEWLVGTIDGTIGFSRGIPRLSTLIALQEDDEPVVGLIELPAVDERYVGWRGGGCRRSGELVRVSQRSDLQEAIVSHGDPYCFDRFERRPVFERMARGRSLIHITRCRRTQRLQTPQHTPTSK